MRCSVRRRRVGSRQHGRRHADAFLPGALPALPQRLAIGLMAGEGSRTGTALGGAVVGEFAHAREPTTPPGNRHPLPRTDTRRGAESRGALRTLPFRGTPTPGGGTGSELRPSPVSTTGTRFTGQQPAAAEGVSGPQCLRASHLPQDWRRGSGKPHDEARHGRELGVLPSPKRRSSFSLRSSSRPSPSPLPSRITGCCPIHPAYQSSPS